MTFQMPFLTNDVLIMLLTGIKPRSLRFQGSDFNHLGCLAKFVSQKLTWYCNFVFVSLCVSISVKKYCKKGWKMIGERCYQFGCTIPSSWKTAEQSCRQKGAYLARIASQNELDSILSWIQTVKFTASLTSQRKWSC